MNGSFEDEMTQLFHLIQTLLEVELTKEQKYEISKWMWGFEDRRSEFKDELVTYWVSRAKGLGKLQMLGL